uniref:Leucine-rich PPR motif-containing protein, mitochondrial n=1 Tax=Lygus hesperus TaxID=30085 RepID=A0A0K8SN95_LYGHE
MSILRSSIFVRNLLTDARFGSLSRMRINCNSLILRSSSTIPFQRFRSDAGAQKKPVKIQPKTIEYAIQRMDRDVRRVGRISGQELLEVFKDIKNTGRATSSQSLFMIRCCGNLVPEESPESRSALVSEVWNTFEKLGVPLDISHYNALLSVYLENDFSCSPKDFLAKLEAKGLEPNRVTYQRLVASCCNSGDIEGATEILQVMKDKQIPINEGIFNSLITGHSLANDMESAVGILSVMKQAGLEPSSATYTALLCGYAKHGDVQAIQRTLKECESNEISITDRDLLEVMFTLIVNDHVEHLEEISNHFSRASGFSEDAKNVSLRLISRGYSSGAIEVLKTMTGLQADDNQPLQKGNFLIRQAIRAKWPADKLISFCEEMSKSGYNPYSYHVAAESSMLEGDSDLSLRLLSALAKKDSVYQHYFWPVLVNYGKSNDFNGVLKTLKQMVASLETPISGETLKDYVMPYLGEDPGIEKLRSAGIPLATCASAMVGHLLDAGKIKEAARTGLSYKAHYNSVVNRRLLVTSFLQTKDLKSLTTLVQIFSEDDGDESDVPGQILLGVIRKNKTLAGDVLASYLETGIGLKLEHGETLKEILGNDITPEINDLLSKLCSSDFAWSSPLKRNPVKRTQEVSIEKDESTILRSIATVEAKGESADGLKRQLLLYYCHNKELDKAMALKQELQKGDLDLQPGLLVLFMDLCCHHGKLEDAMDYYNQAMAKEGSRLDASKAVRLAYLLCQNDRFEEALKILDSHPQSEEEYSENNYGHLSTCWKLLNYCAEKGQVEMLNKIFETMVRQNYIEPTNILLGPLIKIHILRDDVEAALKKFEECCVKYRATPWKNELTCKLIDREDAANLQKVADLSTQIHGEVNSLYDLVLSFVECKKIKQARKILETPGLRTKTQRITSACQRYYSAGQVDHLITLLEATKGFKHIDRSEIFKYLLQSYCKADDVDKAEGLWTQMQEEDVKPSDSFLTNLGELLEKHGRPIPFEVPKSSDLEPPSPRKPLADPKIRAFRKTLHAKDLDEALQLKTELNDADLSKADLSRLSNLLVNNGRIGEASRMLISWLENGLRPDVTTLSYVINANAKIGDIDSMKAIGSFLNQDLKRMVSYSNRYTHCMVEAGMAAKVISEYKEAMEKASTPEEIERVGESFPRGGIFSVFSTNPELLPQVEELAEIYRNKGYLEPTNMLWAQYTIMGDNEKAEKAWSYLKPEDRIMFMPIIKHARQTLDLNMVEDLLNKCRKGGTSSSAIGIIYTSILDILLSQDKLAECEQRLEEALKVCALEDIGRSILEET